VKLVTLSLLQNSQSLDVRQKHLLGVGFQICYRQVGFWIYSSLLHFRKAVFTNLCFRRGL